MSITYRTIQGDTFKAIARRFYGFDLAASRIARANPGAEEPLPAGIDLILPGLDQSALRPVPSDFENETALTVNGRRFRFWESMQIRRSLDSVDTAQFSAPFEPSDPAFRETFEPFTYPDFSVAVGGQPLFTGTIIGIDPSVEPRSRRVSVNGYSRPGVLSDCTFPASAFPLEFNGQNLQDIAATAVEPFAIDVDFPGEAGATFERVACQPDQKILDFLVPLAQQRNRLIASNPEGALFFPRVAAVGTPVATLTEGESPTVTVTPTMQPQEYYSHVTGVSPTVLGKVGKQYTVKNPRLTGTLRPFAFQAPDAKPADLQTAVEAKAGRMFGNIVSYSVTVSTWRDPSGALWQPNTTVLLEAPGAMVYNPYEFLIRTVGFSRDQDTETAQLSLVLPEAFNGQIPERLPWSP